MLVSHDRSLLRSVCDEFWLVSRGGVAPFDGDLDDYQRYPARRGQARAREELKASKGKQRKPKRSSAARRPPRTRRSQPT